VKWFVLLDELEEANARHVHFITSFDKASEVKSARLAPEAEAYYYYM
jgi:hypothetical protein